jgi:L-alanine-DL-glutamate epimerase-like enolase superfamily enzyme
MQGITRLRITEIRLVNLKTISEVGAIEPAWDQGGQMRFTVGGGSIVEVHTNEGLVGIGPGFDPSLLPVMQAKLVGADPFDIEQHAATLRYYAGGQPYRGAAGVDIALWDLIGKACGQPLYKLWGGGETPGANEENSAVKVPVYASLIRLSTPEERAELATRLADEGWQALKLRIHHPTMHEDMRTVELVRKAVGDRMTIMVDANQAQSDGRWQPGVLWDFRRAFETAHELDRMGCYWLEEPLPRFAFNDLAQINQSVAMPIAGGENNRGLHEFVQMVANGVYDILQPESMVLNGVTALRKIGVLAELHGKKICPHHGGRGLGTVAHLHLVASWSHCPYLEMLHDPPIGEYRHGFAMLEEPLVVDSAGFVAVPQGPGLGVAVNRDFII